MRGVPNRRGVGWELYLRGAEVEKNGMGLAAVAGIVFVILLVAMCAGFGGFVFWTRYREEPSKLIDEGNEMTPI